MSPEAADRLIPSYLGQIVHLGRPVGTCFQVHPGVLVTAFHVLNEISCGVADSLLQTQPLGGDRNTVATRVLAVDEPHDLALLQREQPFADSISAIIPASSVTLRSEGFVTGTAQVDDPGHDYRYLTASGRWEGPVGRDDIVMGRFESTGVMRGMSGAPVLRVVDGALIGVVSARYNSPDRWLRDSVWISCGEQVVRLLTASAAVPMQQRLTHDNGTPGLMWVIPDQSAGRNPPSTRTDWLGPRESALEAIELLTALDRAARGRNVWSEVFDQIVDAALQSEHGEIGVQAFKRRTSQRGLDARLLLRDLPFHDSAVIQWASPIAGDRSDQPPPSTLLRYFAEQLRRQLSTELLAGFSATCRTHLEAALAPSGAAVEAEFLATVSLHLPPLVSTSSEAIHVDVGTEGSALERSARARKQGHSRALVTTARRMCRLPTTDPRFFGRSQQVDSVATAIREAMSRQHSALAFLSGQPGVGTSAVAIEVGRQLQDTFEGGVYYVDLHGLIEGAARDEQTVVRIIGEALDLKAPDRESSADLFEWFRAELADLKLLLILDNARDSAQISRILARIDSCGMLVTSRDRRQDFADPDLNFTVEPLAEPDSLKLLRSYRSGSDHRVDDQREVAELCANLPLALRIVGARLGSNPSLDLGYLAHLLRDERTRLDYLESGERAVRAAIRLSYQLLDSAARRTLRLIPALPGATVTARSLSHCAETEEHQQGVLLHRLADRSLASFAMTPTVIGVPDAAFELFELVRLFASEQLIAEEDATEVDGIRLRAARYLLDRLVEINDQVWQADVKGELDPMPFHAAEAIAEQLGELDLASELLRNLWTLYTARNEVETVTAVDNARFDLHIRTGQPERAVKVRLDGAEYLLSHGDPTAAESFLQEARRVSVDIGSGVLEAKASFLLTVVLTKQERWADAAPLAERGVELFVAARRLEDAMSLAINGARIQRILDNPQAMLRTAEQAVEFATTIDDKRGLSLATFELSHAHVMMRRHADAFEMSLRSERLDEELHDFVNAAISARKAAMIASTLDDLHNAEAALTRAIGYTERTGDLVRQAGLLVDLSSLQVGSERYSDALATLGRAAKMPVPDWPPALRKEIRVRSTILTGFLPGSDLDLQVRVPPADEDEDQDPISGLMMDISLTLFSAWQDGSVAEEDARPALLDLLSSFAEYSSQQPFWVLDELAADRPDPPMLQPPPPSGGGI